MDAKGSSVARVQTSTEAYDLTESGLVMTAMRIAKAIPLLLLLLSACKGMDPEKRTYSGAFPLEELEVTNLRIVPWTNGPFRRDGTHRLFFTLHNLSANKIAAEVDVRIFFMDKDDKVLHTEDVHVATLDTEEVENPAVLFPGEAKQFEWGVSPATVSFRSITSKVVSGLVLVRSSRDP